MFRKILFFTLALTVILSISLSASEKKIPLKAEYDDSYAEDILPSRIPSMALSKIDAMPGAVHFIPIKDYYENLLIGEVNIGNNQHTFLLEYEKPFEPGKRNDAMLYFHPLALLLKDFWEKEVDRKAPDNGEKDYPQKFRLRCTIAGINPYGKTKEEKMAPREFFYISNGKPKKNKDYADGEDNPIPMGMGDVERNKLYSAVVGELSSTFYIYDSPDWMENLDRKGLKIKVGIVYPYGPSTYNWGYLRSATALTGQIHGEGIVLYDDNLNNVYAEEGVDSIKVGDSCIATVGPMISVNGKIYGIETGFAMDDRKNYLVISKTEVKTGKIQVKWNGKGAELITAQVKNGSETYPLFKAEDEKKSRGYHAKKDDEKEYMAVVVPEGKYVLQGGVVKREDNYAFFEGDAKNTIEVKAGETTEVVLGEPITVKFTFGAEGEDRVVSCTYPVGAGGECYRWLLPRPEKNTLTIKGEGKGFLEPIHKNMEITDDGKVFLSRMFAYDPVLMVPENGPFHFTLDLKPMVFDQRDVTIVRKDMEVAAKPKPKKKAKAKPKKAKAKAKPKTPAPKASKPETPKQPVQKEEPEKAKEEVYDDNW